MHYKNLAISSVPPHHGYLPDRRTTRAVKDPQTPAPLPKSCCRREEGHHTTRMGRRLRLRLVVHAVYPIFPQAPCLPTVLLSGV